MGGFLFTLWQAGWHPGDPTGSGTPLHQAYLEATTITFTGIVACQIGTAFAARTDRASLFTVGILTNRLLLWGIAFELAFTAAVVYAPPLQHIFGTAALGPAQLAVVAPFPLIVWGADETLRWARRRHDATRAEPLDTPSIAQSVDAVRSPSASSATPDPTASPALLPTVPGAGRPTGSGAQRPADRAGGGTASA
jgi:hypothetical protein